MKYLFVLLFIVSCASDSPEGKTEAEILFKEAQELVEAERYILATEKLNLIKTQHPYSFYATPAELMQADVLYAQENYIEAAAAYLLFRDFHPRHEKIPYVVFMIAESYYKQVPDTIDRDLEPALEAMKYYEEVTQKYADSSYRVTAEEKIKEAKEMLRQKDQYIADFYFKANEYSAARYWYQDILERHRDSSTRQHSILRTVLATYNLKEWQACVDYAEKYAIEVDKDTLEQINSTAEVCKKKL
jgi:outer membrane protein assembly factor BamD